MADVKPNLKLARATRVDQWTSGIRPTWNVSQVKSALYEHQTGNFSQSALLFEAMLADDEFPTSLDNAVNLIAGAPFSLTPVEDEEGEPIEDSVRQADALAPYWSQSFPEHEVANLTRWFIGLGVAVGTIDWDTKGPALLWRPRLRTLHPQFLWWDDSTRDEQTGLMGVYRYNARNAAAGGQFGAGSTDGNNAIVTPGDGKWVLLSDGRESWMRCSIRALATTWLVKQYAWRDWQRYNERHGLPIVVAKVPVMADAGDKDEFFNDIRSFNSETVAMLPTGFDDNGLGYELDLLEAKDQAFGTFETVISRCDRKIQVHFLGTNTNELIGTAGSRATSSTGRQISAEVAAGRERRIATDLRDQLVKPFSMFNVPGADLSLAPWPHYDTEGEEDAKSRAESMKAFADALVSLGNSGYRVANIEEEAERFGLKLEEVETVEPEPETKPMADTEPDDDDDSEEELAALEGGPVNVEDIGRRDGFVASQRYLDGLTDHLTDQADALEKMDTDKLVEIVGLSSSPEDLKKLLKFYAEKADISELGALYEKAILLAQLAGMYGSQQDL